MPIHQRPFKFRIEHNCLNTDLLILEFLDMDGAVRHRLDILPFTGGVYEDTVSLDAGDYVPRIRASGPGGVTVGDSFPPFPEKALFTALEDDGTPFPAKPVLTVDEQIVTKYPYFEMLEAHTGFTRSWPFRSDAQIDPKLTPFLAAGKVGPPRLPWKYDPVEDAACIQINPSAGSIEPETRRVSVSEVTDRRSILFTFDFKYDPGWYYKGEGYMKNYKNWYLYCDEQYFVQASHIHLHKGAEQDPSGVQETVGLLWLGVPGANWKDGQPKLLGEPLSWRVGEELHPKQADFYPKINVLSRHHFYIEGEQGDGVTTSPVHLSTWYSDANREPVCIYNRVPLMSIAPLTLWSFSYDTSGTLPKLNPLMQKWIRNVAVLRGLSHSEVLTLVKKP